MLKRLRIKFVIVIMSIVTVLFGAIFASVMHLTKQNIERESVQMMRTMMFRPPDASPMHKPDKMPDNIRLPFFTVEISQNGEISAFGGDYFDLTDEAMLTELVAAANQSNQQTGILSKYDLRFMKQFAPNGKTIVFADISSEKAMLRGLIRNSIIIGLIGYAVFFVISLLLAKWVTRPVEKTWNEQKQFIADASHELKTPLTVIMTNAEMMHDGCYTEADRKIFTDNILATSQRMRGLVESLLELARLDNSQRQLKSERIDYSRLLNDCILPFEPLFYENDLTLETDIDENITVTGDKEKLRQVMAILLDNALKYCDAAAPVQVRLKKQNGNCLLTVSGQGALLSEADCKNIFKRFYRVDQARSDGKSYGLGLSIAESIVREHRGRIWAESENSCNAFYVSLPLN